MRILICGAGRVGMSIAGYLSQQNNHITVIDNNAELIKSVINAYDIHGICGHASQPDILKKAGADTADIIIAVTDSDEVNMVACQVAHSIFGTSKKIARIRQRSYRDPAWSDLYSRDHMPIDVIITPEEEIADTILNRMSVPGTTNDIHLHDGTVHVFGLIASQDNGLAGQRIKNIYYNLRNIDFATLLIIRNQNASIPTDDTIIETADEIYFAIARTQLFTFLMELGINPEYKGHLVISGGGEIGLFLGELIQSHPQLANKSLTVIERNIERARILNRKLERALILSGDALDADVLAEAGTDKAAVFVSVMNSNESNILSAMIAGKMGAAYTLALSTNRIYNQLLPDRAVDAIINPEAITVSKVLRYVRKGRILAVNTLRQGYAEIIEAEVTGHCSIVNVPVGSINLPHDIRILGVYNPLTGQIAFPKPDTIIKEGDIVSILSLSKDITKVEKLFSFSIDLF